MLYVSGALVSLHAVITGAVDLRRNRGMAVVVAGIALNAAGFILWAPQLLNGTYAIGASPLDAMWMSAMILIGLGAWASEPTSHVRPAKRERTGNTLLPSLMFVVLAAFQIDFSSTGAYKALAVSIGLLVVGCALIAHASIGETAKPGS